MTNLLTPIKKLGKKMTGKDIDGTNLVTVVDDIANKYEGGSGGGGGENVFIVTFSYDEGTAAYSCDKTFSEIQEACQDGSFVFGVIPSDNYYTPYYIGYSQPNFVVFNNYDIEIDEDMNTLTLGLASITIQSDNEITSSQNELTFEGQS